jgi:hypothetical protein
VDYGYLTRLSDDAVPTLVERLPALPADARRLLAGELLSRGGDGDWRTWNLSRSRAAGVVDDPVPFLLSHRGARR